MKMLKKLVLVSLSCFLLLVSYVPTREAKADPITLGILGTVLGGTALGWNILNSVAGSRAPTAVYYPLASGGGCGGGCCGCAAPAPRLACNTCTPTYPSAYPSMVPPPMPYPAPIPAMAQAPASPVNINIYGASPMMAAPMMPSSGAMMMQQQQLIPQQQAPIADNIRQNGVVRGYW